MLSSLSALAFLPFAALILTTFTARGDTYQVLRYTTDNETLVGLTSSGMAVTLYGNPCSFTIPSNPSANCFRTWDHGAIVGESVSLPALDYDDGTPCSPKASGVLYVYSRSATGSETHLRAFCSNRPGRTYAVCRLVLILSRISFKAPMATLETSSWMPEGTWPSPTALSGGTTSPTT